MAETMQRGRGPREYTERAKERNKRGFEVAKKRSGVICFRLCFSTSSFQPSLFPLRSLSLSLALSLAFALARFRSRSLSLSLSRSLALYLAG